MTISLSFFAASVAGVIAMVAWRWVGLRCAWREYCEAPADAEGSGFRWARTLVGYLGRSRVWDGGLMVVLEKSLRTLRLWALKVDNCMSGWIAGLRRRKQRNGANGTGVASEVVGTAAVDGTVAASPEEEPSYLPPEARAREQQMIRAVAENPRAVTVYKDLGFLYLRYGHPQYAREAFEMAIRLGSGDKKILQALDRMRSKGE